MLIKDQPRENRGLVDSARINYLFRLSCQDGLGAGQAYLIQAIFQALQRLVVV